MNSEANKVVSRRFHEECFNTGRLDDMDALCTPDVKIHHGGPPMDLAVGKQLAAMFLSAFPDGRNTIQILIGEDDRVAYRGIFQGTHRGEFQGIPATGKQVILSWITIDRFVAGKIAERWVTMDVLSLLQQLGAVPAQESVGMSPGLASAVPEKGTTDDTRRNDDG